MSDNTVNQQPAPDGPSTIAEALKDIQPMGDLSRFVVDDLTPDEEDEFFQDHRGCLTDAVGDRRRHDDRQRMAGRPGLAPQGTLGATPGAITLGLAVHCYSEMRFGAEVAGWGARRRGVLDRLVTAAGVMAPIKEVTDAYVDLRTWCVRTGHGLGAKDHEADLWVAAVANCRQALPRHRGLDLRPRADHPAR